MSDIHIIPTLEDNYTYVIQTDNKALLIDCGEAKPVIQFLSKTELTPTALLCTHHHGDHIAGIKDLKNIFPDIKIYTPEKDLSRIPNAEIGLLDGQVLTLNTHEIRCIETPGHTRNHLCFHFPSLQSVFTGDALFSLGCGRLFEGTPENLFGSLQKLKILPDNTNIYCGHEYTEKNALFCLSVEPDNQTLQQRLNDIQTLRAAGRPTLPVTLALEKETNLFLKAESVEKIAQLRQLRDQF